HTWTRLDFGERALTGADTALDEPADDAAGEHPGRRADRQIDADRNRERRHPHQLDGEREEHTDHHKRPRQLVRENPVDDERHQRGLGRVQALQLVPAILADAPTDPGIGGRVREYRGHELKRLDSPKATLMALIVDGILTHKLPWALVMIGVFLTLAIELMGVSSLPVAVGVYLPISTSAGMFAGGIVRWLVERRVRSSQRSLAEIASGPGVFFARGLIAG